MFSLSIRSIILLLAFAVTWTLSFLLTMLGLQHIPYATLSALRVLIGVLFLLPFVGRSISHLKLERTDWVDFSLLALFGVVLAQLFQVMYRYSYAPPATDMSFLLNLAPVFILFLSAFVLSEKMAFPKTAGIVAGVLGMVLILANWERPSTFSPFSRYPREEMFMLLAALWWALFTVHARKVLRKHDPLTVTVLTLALGLIPLLVVALARDGIAASFNILPSDWVTILLLGVICTGASYLLWYQALREIEASEAGVVLFVMPVLMTSLVGIESKIRFFGTNPIVFTPVAVGSILIVAAVYVTWAGWLQKRKEDGSGGQFSFRFSRLDKTLIFFAASGLALGLIAFFLPVKANYVKGVLLNDALYESQWHTNAYETVGGYLILLAGAVNLIVAMKYLRSTYGISQLLGWSGFSALLLVSTRLAGDTVFFSWVPWIPAEIQHAIGTEYVRVWEAAVRNVPMVLSISASILFLFVALVIAILEKVEASKEVRSQPLR